ncbi:MAG: pilus assembly protein PilY [Geobacter sp.]|nr:pilus assembly protein PilY [Geobacter sp.]
MKSLLKTRVIQGVITLVLSVLWFVSSGHVSAEVMNNYCVRPPFISQPVPPMVMFQVGRDHKLYYEAYNDGVDLDGDGKIDKTYDHSIEYYGYFNPYKCYTHTGGSGNNDLFEVAGVNTDRFCTTGQWSGNLLNWMTMSRMDVLRKVMYGGQRSQESPKNVLNRAYIPQDAHSWGKEYTGRLCYNSTTGVYKQQCLVTSDCDTGFVCTDKSVNLMGVAAPVSGTPCTTSTITWGGNGKPGKDKMLVVRYPNQTATTGADHDDIMAAIDTTQFKSGFNPSFVTDFNDTILAPGSHHCDDCATVVVAEFYTPNGTSGNWQFAIDGDDGVELEVRNVANGNIVQTTTGNDQIGYYGAHSECSCQSYAGSIGLTQRTWYRLIARGVEHSGQDGVKVWYKKPGATTWTIFGDSAGLDVRAPNIVVGTNECTLKSYDFINTGIPIADPGLNAPGRHLVCNTTLSGGVPTSSPQAQTLIRVITNSNHRIWEWASKERPVCGDTFSDGSSATTNRIDYTFQVEVCKSGVGTLSEENKFERCRLYGSDYRPIGLFQKYGEYKEDGTGVSKVCSTTMGKPCSNDNDCGTGEGLCFDKSAMYFGFMTTTYTKNLSGGVLRKNPGPVSDEVNMNNGTQQTSENDRGNLIISMDRMKVIDFDYGSHSYSNCGWITTRPINEGECKMWGNPIAEMMYESLRYFAGKGLPTAEFTYSTTADAGVNLSKPAWGYNKGSTWYQPYDIFPSCAQAFNLVLSDVNTSYDSDQIPGSHYAKPNGTYFAEDANSPQLGLGQVTSGSSLLNQLLDTISATEGVDGNNWFIGESNGTTDFICSAKSVTNLHLVRGTCPEEPTKKGSYYAAALAYYGKTKFTEKIGKPPINTFVIALSSPFADIKIKAGGKFVNIVPVGKSVSGSHDIKTNCWDKCTTRTIDADGLKLSNCSSTAFCPTNSLVDFYIDDLKYDSSNDIVYSKFRVNFEDVEQGADHDMDAIATYEICTQVAADEGYGSCGGTLSGDLQVKVNSDYAAGSIDQVLGFVISGTTADGTYLVVKDKDVGGTSPITSLPLTSVLDFSVSTTTAAAYLKNPLWYAAKWGGFTGSGTPDTAAKWDRDGDGLPDNYFPVSNPLQLDSQLEKALNEILARVASGTAASILNNSEGSGANLLQAVFYPKKQFDNSTEASWIGEMQNLWYFIDPFLNKTSIREDTNQDNVLHLQQDYVTKFYFDPGQSKTLVQRFVDADGDGSADSSTPLDTVDPDNVKSLWKAGRKLWERDVTSSGVPRTIYTRTGNSTFDDGTSGLALFSDATGLKDDATIRGYLQVSSSVEAAKLINYVHGIDQPGYRDRKVTIAGCGLANCTREWKLGDIVSSTPKLVSNVKLNTYDLAPPNGYNDSSYKAFADTSVYKNRGVAVVGGNDGMLHAFKLGVLKERSERYAKAQMNDESGNLANSADELGKELWSFIPRHALPYLRYLTCKKGGGDTTYCNNIDYDHIFLVDRTPTVADASIMIPADTAQCTNSTDYSTCNRLNDGSTWTTVLIGGMGFGGASRNSSDTCTQGATGTCIKTPVTSLGYSSYFALDVKDPAAPKYLWEFAGDPTNGHYLGAATTGPAVVRINSGTGKNGKWLAVFASGPTGPIDTTKHQFMGTSSQNLKLYVVDLKTGTLLRTIDTGIANAFAGTLSSAVIDTDRSKSDDSGYYSDDAIYIGLTKKDTATNTWTKGGVLRLLTKENPDPAQWVLSTVLDNTGPVTTTITKLQDRKNKTLWLFFGTGRYFYKNDDPATGVQQRLYGIKEPCYYTSERQDRTPYTNITGGSANDLDLTCTTSVSGTLTDQSGTPTTAPAPTLSATSPGWYINLDAADSAALAERVITDPVALANGNVFFTTFKPSADICKFGGDSLIWALKYDTGAAPPARTMQGTALMQVSTGAFAEVKLSTAFKNTGNLRLDNRRLATPIQGVPPTAQGLSLITNPKPLKKFIHVREK